MNREANFSSMAPPTFDVESYQIWAVRMWIYLQALDLWEAVEYEIAPLLDNPTVAQIKTHKEKKTRKSKALACLFTAVSSNIFTRIMSLESAKKVWDHLKTEYKGDERIRGMQMLNLVCSSSTKEKLKVGGMSTSESCSSGKIKAYGEVTTNRLCESFKEKNYPDYDVREKFEQSGGWIKALPEEAENERMHLMTMVELVQPKWYERLLVIAVQGAFFNFYFVFYLLFPKLAHRVVGHLEEESIHSYTLYLNNIDRGKIENFPAPAIAIDYWRLPKNATIKDVDEAYHRDVNHFASPWETYQADLSIDLRKYHVPKKFLNKVAYWLVKLLRIPTDLFFKEIYGCHTMMLETVAGVPGMVGGMLLHLRLLRKFELLCQRIGVCIS
ncbi:Ubiquinol oxidase 2, mitochondrial [Capsicum chinense]|nr:Ubiquinol oxidase 2, mitochondrial [Capsicum chinense]